MRSTCSTKRLEVRKRPTVFIQKHDTGRCAAGTRSLFVTSRMVTRRIEGRLTSRLNSPIEDEPLPGTARLWLYQHFVVPKLSWAFLTQDLTKCSISCSDQSQNCPRPSRAIASEEEKSIRSLVSEDLETIDIHEQLEKLRTLQMQGRWLEWPGLMNLDLTWQKLIQNGAMAR